MNQQVNFYQARFREQRTRFPAILLLQVAASVIVTLFMLSTYAGYQVNGVGTDLELIAAQEAAAVKRLENLRSTIDEVIGETSWADRLDHASSELSEKEASLRLISGTELGDAKGFARHLEALAEQTMPGLWLTNIALSAKGERVWLQGEALRADLVPSYLQYLAGEEPFEAQRFHRLEIDRDEDKAAQTVSFVVTSDATLDAGKEMLR
ncbi:MAG: PilN domain-containing protein [Halioglobus sp.]|nr:PilN domain-containing protein [Halioglobus sp.]